MILFFIVIEVEEDMKKINNYFCIIDEPENRMSDVWRA